MAPGLPASLPDLPSDDPWSYEVHSAHKILLEGYQSAYQLLRREDGDALRLRHHSQRITNNLVPILEALEDEGLPQPWVIMCAQALGGLLVELETAAIGAERDDQVRVEKQNLVTQVSSGRPGRPRKDINPIWLSEATKSSRLINRQTLAQLLGMHRNTLRKKLKLAGVYERFTALSNHDLDILLRVFKRRRPESGLSYIIGFLRRHGVRVQKERIRQSYRRVNTLGQALRRNEKIQRRQYGSPRPNFCWHCDGHHKLIRWGFVIHGFIDGYCRTVTGLRASTNNRASTVLEVFMKAIEDYGVPSKVRGDRGGENIRVAVWMIMTQGPGRSSFIWGSSTRNTRIERLWVEVGTQFARRWRAFFTRLEKNHHLDVSNSAHLWLLHYLFESKLNEDCQAFQDEWNHHPLSGPKTKGKSPLDLRFVGETIHGTAADDFAEVHPETLSRYLSVSGEPVIRRPGCSGAGHPPDEESDVEAEDSDQEALSQSEASESSESDEFTGVQNQIAADLQANIKHQAVKVPRHRNPFTDAGPSLETVFYQALEDVQGTGFVPAHFGVQADEWDDGRYPSHETIPCGRRSKEIVVELPEDVWLPRAIAWAQGLSLLNQVLFDLADSD